MGDTIMNRSRRSIHDFLIDDDDHALNHESVELKFEENIFEHDFDVEERGNTFPNQNYLLSRTALKDPFPLPGLI